MREIVTLQFGQKSNYVATHFWNTQESYFTYSENEESLVDHNVHFRPGVGPDGSETFTPRTVIYDLKGGFGTLRKYNELYEVEEPQNSSRGLWDGNEVVQPVEPIPKNEYQKSLDLGISPPQLTADAVRYWSDFNRIFYHPKSVVQLNEYELGSQTRPFENWQLGEELFNSLDSEHDILDQDLRPFVEECDQLGTIQIFSGLDDAWGGFAARYIDRLKDEFGRKSIWLWGLDGGTDLPQTHLQRPSAAAVNSARSLHDISTQVSMYVPVCKQPNNVLTETGINRNADLGLEWYSSALICTGIESVGLPTRLRQQQELEPWLAGEGGQQTIFNLELSVGPGRHRRYASSSGSSGTFDMHLGILSSAASGEEPHIFSEVQVVRDFEALNPNGPWGSSLAAQDLAALTAFPTFRRFYLPLEFPLLTSFPPDLYANQGFPGSSLRIRCGLSASTHIGNYVKRLQHVAKGGLPLEEREDLVSGLGDIYELYRHGWEDDSDSGDE